MPSGTGGRPSSRVLVVDEHADTQEMLAELLKLAGLSVVCCDSVEAALVEIGRDVPEAVVTDVRLGDASGFELARVVRAKSADAVLVAVSGLSEPAGAEGVFDVYYLKPIDVANFAANVRSAITARSTGRDGGTR